MATAAIPIEQTILFDSRSFASYLYEAKDWLEEACTRSDVSLNAYKDRILELISEAKNWPGRYRFICDINSYRSKVQCFERCFMAIENSKKYRSSKRS